MELNTTGKQLFLLTAPWNMDSYEVEIAIDFDFPDVKEKIKEMSIFWNGAPEKSAPFEEHLDFFLRLTASRVFYLKMDGFNDYGVAKEFSETEGYYPLDGSHGILVKTSSFPEIDSDSFDVTTQSPYSGSFEIEMPKW